MTRRKAVEYWTAERIHHQLRRVAALERRGATIVAGCSCGCLYFLRLSPENLGDWGVCGNPQSPRKGMLTWEHQGCPQFEGG